MQDRWIDPGRQTPSSFAYRIDAAQLLSRVVEVNQEFSMDEDIETDTIDACLAGFLMSSTGPGKVCDIESGIDEMVLEAQMIVHL